jgi:uncharacterized protein YbaR (Trm112 family)
MSDKTLWKTLHHRSGSEWVQEFHCEKVGVHEKVVTSIPRLLPQEIIDAIHERAAANKTYYHGQLKHRYLLSRMVFCNGCGRAMGGHAKIDRPGCPRVYRHAFQKRMEERCPCPCPTVSADALEKAVLWELFRLFGNPAAGERAVEAATPNRDKIDAFRHRLDHVSQELKS